LAVPEPRLRRRGWLARQERALAAQTATQPLSSRRRLSQIVVSWSISRFLAAQVGNLTARWRPPTMGRTTGPLRTSGAGRETRSPLIRSARLSGSSRRSSDWQLRHCHSASPGGAVEQTAQASPRPTRAAARSAYERRRWPLRIHALSAAEGSRTTRPGRMVLAEIPPERTRRCPRWGY